MYLFLKDENTKSITYNFLFFLIGACQTQTPKTPKTGEGTEYIVNEHDFGDYKKFKRDTSLNEHNAKAKKNQTKEDSIKAYIKELSHHFHLQEKQMKALEYIYAKYNKKEAKAQNDTAKLNKLLSEKEKSIEVVFGEHLYARKGKFDKNYKQHVIKLENPKGTWNNDELDKYLDDLSVALKIHDYKKAIIKRLINSYDKKISKLIIKSPSKFFMAS